MVGVIVDDQATPPDASKIETSTGGPKGRQDLLELAERHALQPTDRHGRCGVAEVVPAGQGQLDRADVDAAFVEGRAGAIPTLVGGEGREGHTVACFGGPPAVGVEMLPENRAVTVGKHPVGGGGEPLQRVDQRLDVGIVVGVIQLHVGQHRQVGENLTKEPSDSSASATNSRPLP